MDWTGTLIGLATSGLIGVFAWWRSEQAPDPNRVRLIPWMTVLILCVVVGLLFAVHLVNLAGVETGRTRF